MTPGAAARYCPRGRAPALDLRRPRRPDAGARPRARRAAAALGRAARPAARDPGRLGALGGGAAHARRDRAARADLRLLGLPGPAVPGALPGTGRALAGRAPRRAAGRSRAAPQPAWPRPRRVDAARAPLPRCRRAGAAAVDAALGR